METVITISLNGYPYTLTENAYRTLRRYLDALINRFGQSSEAKETYEAIEARIGELLSERQKGLEPISDEIIRQVIDILGQPEDIDAEQESNTANSARQNAEEAAEKQRNSMRLYRDIDNKIISGVCAGIAARLGTNAAVIRLLFLVAVLVFGVGIIVYIVLWAAVPAAYTPLQKLRMKGNPITLDSIRTEVNLNFKSARQSFLAKGDNQPSNFVNSIGNLLSLIIIGLTKLIVKIIAIAFIIGGAAGITALTALLAVALFGDVQLAEQLFGYTTGTAIDLFGWNSAPRIVAIAIWGVCIVPLASLFLAGMQLLVKFRVAKLLGVVALVFWIACIVTLAVLMPITNWQIKKHIEEFDTEYTIPLRANDTLRIDIQNNSNGIVGAALDLINHPNIEIRSTYDSIATLRICYYAVYFKKDQRNALNEIYAPSIDTAVATLPSLQSPHDSKSEPALVNVRAIIYLPEGAMIRLSPAAARKAEGYGAQRIIHGQELSRSTWQMRDDYLATPCSADQQNTNSKGVPPIADSSKNADTLTADRTTAN